MTKLHLLSPHSLFFSSRLISYIFSPSQQAQKIHLGEDVGPAEGGGRSQQDQGEGVQGVRESRAQEHLHAAHRKEVTRQSVGRSNAHSRHNNKTATDLRPAGASALLPLHPQTPNVPDDAGKVSRQLIGLALQLTHVQLLGQCGHQRCTHHVLKRRSRKRRRRAVRTKWQHGGKCCSERERRSKVLTFELEEMDAVFW